MHLGMLGEGPKDDPAHEIGPNQADCEADRIRDEVRADSDHDVGGDLAALEPRIRSNGIEANWVAQEA